MDNRIINRENDFCRLNAMRFAIKPATFKGDDLSLFKNKPGGKIYPVFYPNFHNIVVHYPLTMKKLVLIIAAFTVYTCQAQIPDYIYKENIRSVKLFNYADIFSYPVIVLNSTDQLELHFDDMDADIKNYYYSYQLCNADWTPSTLFSFDYIKGFQSNRITTYRNSSIAYDRYTHYQATLPDRNCTPTRSGNYLLKVFINDDTSKLVFTKRFFVVDNNKVSVAARMMTPLGGQFFRTHQRVQVAINTANAKLNTFSPQDIKVTVVQNYSWPSAVLLNRPTIYRGNYYEYSDDALSFPAGREWRWLNLTSIRLMSDRVTNMVKGKSRTDVYVKPDGERSQQVYIFYRDNNGLFSIENSDGNNPYWQSDYMYTHFTFAPPGNRPYGGKDIYLYGELTNYSLNDSSKMIFNEEKGVYERTLFLKQGYYNYSYVTRTEKSGVQSSFTFDNTEGNFQATENTYMVLIYFRSFGARADELIGFTTVNSLSGGF
jgi:hypothetical protein